MNILFIDPPASKNMGIAILDEKFLVYSDTYLIRDYEQRLKEIYDEVERLIKEYKPVKIYVEQVLNLIQKENNAVMKLLAQQYNLPFQNISSRIITKYILEGNNANKKKDTYAKMIELYGKENVTSEHCADAIALGLAHFIKT